MLRFSQLRGCAACCCTMRRQIKQPLCVCTRELSDGWARVDCASRAAKNSPPGCFCAVFCDSAAAVRIRPLSPEKVSTKQKIQYPVRILDLLVGAGGFEPPKLKSSRFTVCPHWPLGNTPRFCSRPCRTTCLF